MTRTPAPIATWPTKIVRGSASGAGQRDVPEETAIAIVVDGGSEAVMMATPSNLEDFAYGFALTEGVISSLSDIRDLEFVTTELGIEARLWLADGARNDLAQRRRRRAGPVGCGLCGVESLADAMRPVAPVTSQAKINAAEIVAAMAALPKLQTINARTHAVHAAAFYTSADGIVVLREDIGRHNALDKIIGALAREGRDASDGIVLMTSRVSVELIQKAAYARAPVLAAISAPTTLALRLAEAAQITVCAIVRNDGFEVFTGPDRIIVGPMHAD